jgi:hypothetical protein
MVALAANREGVADRLREGPYAPLALPPATPWLAEPVPLAPQVQFTRTSSSGPTRLTWAHPGGPPWRHLVLHLRRRGVWQALHFPVPGEAGYLLDEYADLAVLRAVGRTGVESAELRIGHRQESGWSLVPPQKNRA